jgi:cobalt-zinc-cadmium efflux system membrane fusion protein
MRFDNKSAAVGGALTAAVLIVAFGIYHAGFLGGSSSEAPAPSAANGQRAKGSAATPPPRSVGAPPAAFSVDLSPSELEKFKVEPAVERDFGIQRETVGTIDFNQEMSVQVFPPFQGKIIALFAKAGDDVQKGAALFTIDSPDLVQAESTLVSAAGTLNLTTRVLDRAKQLYVVQGVAQKDLDQATSEQQAAEGALKAARDALRIFGKADAEMDRIVADRKIDSVLTVKSPISGRVTTRNAAPGLFVQPGNATAPYTVSDLSTMWMLASVPETDIPLLRLGQGVDVAAMAYPGRVFRAKITNIGASVDPNTHRALVRSEVRDPGHELRPGMFATFVIRTGKSMRSVAVPYNGVVREGDGTMTVWVTTDHKRLVKRVVKIGLQQGGLNQILEGLKPGELVATDGALFLNNALTAASR